MSDPEKVFKVDVPAELTIANKTQKVTVTNLSMHACIVRTTTRVKMYQKAVLRLFEDKGDNKAYPYNPIKVTIEKFSRKSSDPDAFYVNIKFNKSIRGNQGVVQSLHAVKYNKVEESEPAFSARKNSLRVKLVSCHMCGKENIPFWSLKSHSMLTKSNIFGVPLYVEAISNRDFCDFNLIRVIVCPNCFFASSYISDFHKSTDSPVNSKPLFDRELFLKNWESSKASRKQLVQPYLNSFFSEDRNLDQALLSYDLAIITTDELYNLEEGKDPRRKNYDLVRKSVFYLMIKAELHLANNLAKEAESLLRESIERLEKIFPYLNHTPSIRVTFLLGMLNLYFEEHKKVAQYITCLREFNKNGEIKRGTDEYKVLTTNLDSLNEAFQNREEYSKNKLIGFQKPF